MAMRELQKEVIGFLDSRAQEAEKEGGIENYDCGKIHYDRL